MTVDDFKIPKVYRSFVTYEMQNHFDDLIKSDKWKYFHTSNGLDVDNTRFFKIRLRDDEFINTVVFNKVKETLPFDVELLNVYMNGHIAACGGKTHIDDTEEDALTFLVYCNKTWAPDLGGSTLFDIMGNYTYFYPHPMSALCFKSNINHCAQPVSKDFLGMRATLVFKLKVINNDQNDIPHIQ